MFDSVSTVIPGASRPEQIIENVKAADLKPLTKHQMDEVERIYNTYIKPHVHHLW
jgi:aryl-alcohol dehydrogenase-like predicted oxidoreductase